MRTQEVVDQRGLSGSGELFLAAFQKTGDEDGPDDEYTVTMLFFGAPAKYTFLVTKRDSGGNSLQTVKDIDFASTDPTDFVSSTVEVIAV